MNYIDIVKIIENISTSLGPIQHLVTGIAYLIGITFFMVGLQRLRAIANFRARSASGEKLFVPIAYLLGGAAFVFLPSTVDTMVNTAFGAGNVLRYTSVSHISIEKAMSILIQTIGIIWFVRGTLLLVVASQPGVQHGPKGLVFLIAGVIAINFQATVATINTLLGKFVSFTLTAKGVMGY